MQIEGNEISKPEMLTLAFIFSLAAILIWLDLRVDPVPVSVATPAAPAPEVVKLSKVDTPVAFKAIKTYPAAVKPKLGLPAPVQADDNQQLIAASKLPADSHTQTVTTVLDIKTGDTETFVRRDPLPLIAFDYSGDAGLYWGYRNGAQAIRLEARQGFITLKAIHLGGIVSIDQPIGGMQIPPSTFIGIGAWGRW